MSQVVDETPVSLVENTTPIEQESTSTTTTTTNATTASSNQDQSEISLWAHETPFLNQTEVEMTDLQDDSEIVQFSFKEIPAKIREAEQHYDKCNYDASTAILVKCIQLYDEEYGERWFHKALDQDRPLIELPNITELLEFARLVKEYALNMVLLAKLNDSLSSKGDEAAAAAAAAAATQDTEQGEEEQEDEEPQGNGFDDDSEDEEECEEEENKETYFNYATENLQVAYEILGRYIIERSYIPKDSEEKIFFERVIKGEDGKDQTLKYSLGNSSKRHIPASDLLPFLWRKDPSVNIRDVEVCQIYLGDVYDSLADVHIEEEQWNDAAHYLELSLLLRRRTEKSYGRGLASIHTKYASYYALRHQYEFSNQHFLLAASVFGQRTLDKIDWLYDNLSKHYKLDEKCPRQDYIGSLTKATSALDMDVLMKQEDISNLRKFVNEQLIPTITNRVFAGEITMKEVKEAVNNITDYFQIIDSIMDLYSDNMLDIEEGRNQQGLSIEDQSSKIDETQRVKKMVEEVWRTDSIMDSVGENGDVNEALGFKKINKTGTLEGTLAEAKVDTAAAFAMSDAVSTTTASNAAPAPISAEPAFAPVVKRKARGPAAGEDEQAKRQRTAAEEEKKE